MSTKIKNENKGKSVLSMGLKRLFRNKLALFGLIVVVTLIFTSVFAPLLTPYDRDSTDLKNTYQKPSKEHILGTDELGRDVFTRMLYGGQVSLSVGLLSTTISTFIGIILGAIGGYFGKRVDIIIMRIVDIFMCFPFFVIAISMAAILGPSVWNVIIISGLLSWTNIARIVRAEVMTIKEREFVESAKAMGLNGFEIIFRHILPNTIAVILVYATLGIAHGILSEASLSFLGLGVKQPQPSWGNMLASAQNFRSLTMYWWLWVPSGLLVFLTILSINFLGDGLRDALDPKLKK